MEQLLSLPRLIPTILLLLLHPSPTLSSCNKTCGSIAVRYPFGTAYGCGSPLFHPFVTCTANETGGDSLVLTSHRGAYQITSISYSTSTLTISPPLMSTCSNMFPSTPPLGIDWSSPFQLGPSLFLLLACRRPTNPPICDTTKSHLCALIHTCPTIVSLGLPIFAPTDTCCVYSPASLGPRDDLDIKGLDCKAYTSVESFGRVAMDPRTWEYGVVLKYSETMSGFEEEGVRAEVCGECEGSGGVCGFAPPRNYFVCVCENGMNTTTSCGGMEKTAEDYWSSANDAALILVKWFQLLMSLLSVVLII